MRALALPLSPLALSGLALVGSLACSSSASVPAASNEPAPAVAEPAPEVYESPVAQGTIARAELLPVLDSGVGQFLRGVGVEPHMEAGRFVGFRITRLYPGDERFQNLALQPGDTVVAINQRPIERPEHASQIFNELRVASALVVSYLHEGEPQELRFEIVD